MSTPPSAYVGEQQARAELESYILGGQYGNPAVPRNLDPQFVDQFIRTRVDRRTSPSAFRRSRRAADWYDLRSLADHFEKMLDRNERSEKSYDQSLAAVALVGTVGNDEQARRAVAYWAYLVGNPLAVERFDLLVETFAELAPLADAGPLVQRLKAQMQTVKPGSDDYERLDQELNNNLPRAQDEARLERDIAASPDPAVRTKRLAQVYAGWDEAESMELTWWSARWLRRMARAGQAQTVIAALRAVLADVQAAKLPPDQEGPYRTRILRAVRFLGGALSDTERRFLERSASKQWDVLDWDDMEQASHG
ncbi:MAG: hypothetical protein ABSB23_07810 [Bryobacteraceae bacterium]|jgi:hypothetical protein